MGSQILGLEVLQLRFQLVVGGLDAGECVFLFSGGLQAFIFAMLTMLYISGGFPAEEYAARKKKREERRAARAAIMNANKRESA